MLDLTLPTPEENLALDEVILDDVETGRAEETLRFWESPTMFVVLGVSQPVRQEVREQACLRDGIPILRRCSAGGCVLQGPGCLNYSLLLSHERRLEIRTLRGSYCHILGRIARAFERRGLSLHHKGVSDLALKGRKVSGNAQKRRRNAILHHGTLLYGMDTDAMEKYLREPAERPVYRGERTHRGFVTHLPLSADELQVAVCEAFGVNSRASHLQPWEFKAARELAHTKYASADWTYRR
ncbi:MAG: lipoate--protein ligase family protein [Candidatus Hydrogenedentes bacterium]|nr:lipoate--protein ligase family protein [Candidatus Hydrogenedentota bacterium]